MVRFPTLRGYILSLTGLAWLSGCGGDTAPLPSPEPTTATAGAEKAAHDSDDVPITAADVERPVNYDDAIARIKSYRDSIRGDIAADRPTKAHRALDELDIVLDWLPEIARDSGIPKDRWETVNTAGQALREQFNRVHAQIDAGEDPDYEAIAAGVDAAITRLEAVKVASADDAES